MYGCKKMRTTPDHPQGNGACERFNRTLLALLCTIETQSWAQWPSRLPALLQAYNNTTHASTGMTPHYVVFGRHARLPVDMLYEVAPPQCRDSLEGWVQSHHQTLLQAYASVRNNAERRNHWNQRHYNRNTRTLPLLPGERVLMRNFRRRAQGKLAPRWLPAPFVVVRQSHPDRPVFTIRPEGKDGPCRTLHLNNLRPCPGDPPTINNDTAEGQQNGVYEPGIANRPEPFWPPAPVVLVQPAPPYRLDPGSTSLPEPANVPSNPIVTPPHSSASVAPSQEAPGPELRMVGTAQDTIVPPQPMIDPCTAPEHYQNSEPCAPSRYPVRDNRGNLPVRYRP